MPRIAYVAAKITTLLAVTLLVSLAQAQPIPVPREGKPPDFPGVSVDRPAPKSDADREKQENKSTTEQTPSPPSIVQDQSQPPGGNARSADAEQREKDDLVAQQTMAEATLKMLELTRWQIRLGIVGAALLLAALYYSARQTKAAADAAKAAVESNQIQRDNFIASERPRVIVDGIAATGPFEWGEAQAMLKFAVKLRNIGKTAAVAADLRVEIVLHQPDARTTYQNLRSSIEPLSEEHGFIIEAADEFVMQYSIGINKGTIRKYATRLASAHPKEEFDRRYQKASAYVFPILVGCVTYATLINDQRYFAGFIARVSGRGPDGRGFPLEPNVGSIPVENLRVTMYPSGKLMAE